MEHTLFDNGVGRTIVFFGDDFTSIDYEYTPTEQGFEEEGNFLFEIDDVCRVFDIWDEASVVRLLRESITHCRDAKEAWTCLLHMLDDNDIECTCEQP